MADRSESSTFWAVVGAAVFTLGGALVGIGAAQATGGSAGQGPWRNGWFLAGSGALVLGIAALVMSLILRLRHGRLGTGMAADPSEWKAPSFEVIRAQSHILVIDDQDFPYRKLFQKDGYHVDKWSDVKNLSDLESGAYDLILLDLQGVGTAHSADQGLGVLDYIRDRRPAQIVIAFSSQDWSLKHQPFFDKADAILYKGADYLDFKKEVDRLLGERYSLSFYLERIEVELGDGALPDKLRKRVRRALLEAEAEALEDHLRRRAPEERGIERAMQVAREAIELQKRWKNRN